MRNYLRNFFDNWHSRRHHKVHRQIKDRLFRFLFEKDREALLQLYNALNGTNYKDSSLLQVVTIESAVYVVMKNDLAFIIAGVLNLYEHQSAVNPNMPVRFLIYLAQEYQGIIEKAQESLYGSKQILLPTPHCVVFYNGKQDIPEEQTLKLSDAADRKAALNDAILYCTQNHILEEFLRKYRTEVLGMLLEEFDVNKYERSLKEEGREEGETRLATLLNRLFSDNRMEDTKLILTDKNLREKLYREYGIK